jgi:hypothetical protein
MQMTSDKLNLNDGWTQIPPKEDGIFWFGHAKEWYGEDAYDRDLMILVEIRQGRRIWEMEQGEPKWLPECGDLVWNHSDNSEMVAVWRRKRDNNIPPEIKGALFPRRPAHCPKCNSLGAVYRYYDAGGKHKPLFVCYNCNHDEEQIGRAHV